MSSKVTVTTVEQIPKEREPHLIDTRAEIIRFGTKNNYPQRSRRILRASPTGIACRNLLSKFIVGKAWENQDFGNAIINFKGQTANALLRLVARDFAEHSYFGLHVNYNLNFEITSITRIEPTFIRLGLPDSNQYSPRVAIHPNWTGDNKSLIKVTPTSHPADLIDKFSPDPEVVSSQIERAGGINQYKGQVYVFWGDEEVYPETRFDSVMLDLQTDALIAKNANRRLNKGFIAKQAFMMAEALSDDERYKVKQKIKEGMGADGDDVFLIDGVGEGNLEIMPFDHTYSDADNINLEQSTRRRIMRVFNQPSILHSEERANALSADGSAIENAYDYYNQITIDDRRIVQEAFMEIIPFFMYDLNPTDNYQIVPAEFTSMSVAGENTTEEIEENADD